ncbi:MAG: hypothetical protein GKR94_22520 [Gammaproteobacteria bacterium]|nr:hypothetical protein [Gammaproteobacteria bacterium]
MDRVDATLDGLQNNLLAHFRSLAAVRERSGFPIFALEHGMSPSEIQRVNGLLRERHRTRQPIAPYWLLWAVYASEAGYGYTGDEYWTSFEKQTPNWQYHDRPKVKRWFGKFQKSFNGVVPAGIWAEHFSIIAWPITHALLPRYLQFQFARLLYDLRFRLASASLDAGSIGRLLAAHASHTSTRFQAFLEQEQLTGQIVAALLRGESVDANDLIHPPTLNRIVSDLECVRSSREWLKETRRVVSDRFKGIGRGTYRPGSPTTPTPADDPSLPDASRFAIRPDLFLRHAGNGKWSVLLQLKSLRPIAAESTALRVFLDRTRCRLNGATDWKPTGWLLSGNRMGALRRWPDADVPLIRFERADPLMDHLLESEYRLTPGPLWLFRIGNDGIARHIASSIIRPANDYIVVTVRDMPRDVPGLTLCTLDCEGVHAFRFTVPSHVPADVTTRYRELGIDVARTIRVWPAGLPGRGWDGDGSTEWLTTESPCFGITPDHPLDALSFRLDDGSEQVVAADPLGGPTFVRLPRLRPGLHSLTVEAHRSPDLDDAVSTPPAKGFARLAVREPEPWTPGVASHPGLIVTSDPFDANLDILWRNELSLSVNGPEGFTVSVRVELHTADGQEILSDPVSNSMALPITRDAWRHAFAHFLDNEARAWKYLEAASCTLEINGDSLGKCTLRFDHDPSPLRWALAFRKHQPFVRLVDDSGQHDTVPDVRFFGMDRPLVDIPLDAESARTDVTVPPPGGLYVARHPPFDDAVVVSAPTVRLQDLGVEPNAHVPAGLTSVRGAFCLLRLWHNARQAGFLVDVRRSQVTRSIFNAIFRSMCGKNWARAEENFAERPLPPRSLKALETLVDKRKHFGRRLGRQGDADESESAVAARFAAEAKRLGLSQDQDLCHFALRLAACQDNVFNDPHLDERVGQLVDNPALLRGARLVWLLRERHSDRRDP